MEGSTKDWGWRLAFLESVAVLEKRDEGRREESEGAGRVDWALWTAWRMAFRCRGAAIMVALLMLLLIASDGCERSPMRPNYLGVSSKSFGL